MRDVIIDTRQFDEFADEDDVDFKGLDKPDFYIKNEMMEYAYGYAPTLYLRYTEPTAQCTADLPYLVFTIYSRFGVRASTSR